MKTRGDKWSENEISLTKELYQKGLIISDIAPKVNHTDNAVIKKLKELGLTGNRRVLWTDEDLDKLRDLFNQELPYSEIAQKLGKTVRACQGKAIKLGLKKKEVSKELEGIEVDQGIKVEYIENVNDKFTNHMERLWDEFGISENVPLKSKIKG